MKDPRRWLLLLAIAAAVGFFLIGRGPKVQAPHSPCLTHDTCLRAERCYVVPAGDGFASYGVCADPCTDDSQCGGLRCLEVASLGSHLAPVSTAKQADRRERVCVKPRVR